MHTYIYYIQTYTLTYECTNIVTYGYIWIPIYAYAEVLSTKSSNKRNKANEQWMPLFSNLSALIASFLCGRFFTPLTGQMKIKHHRLRASPDAWLCFGDFFHFFCCCRHCCCCWYLFCCCFGNLFVIICCLRSALFI